jgi:hypothetical protein
VKILRPRDFVNRKSRSLVPFPAVYLPTIYRRRVDSLGSLRFAESRRSFRFPAVSARRWLIVRLSLEVCSLPTALCALDCPCPVCRLIVVCRPARQQPRLCLAHRHKASRSRVAWIPACRFHERHSGAVRHSRASAKSSKRFN